MAEFIDYSIKHLDSVDSTNNYATQLVKLGDYAEGVVIMADEQTCGRGQINNTWESEKGKNLLLSIILKPHFLPIQQQFMLSKVICLAICETNSEHIVNISIKWPNDIYIGDKKVAGVLIENSIMGSQIDSTVAGIGLNVNQTCFRSNAPNPISLAALTQTKFDIEALLHRLLENINKWYSILRSNEYITINNAYSELMYRKNQEAFYADSTGEFAGTIIGVNAIGQLIIRKKDNTLKEYHFKEVTFLK